MISIIFSTLSRAISRSSAVSRSFVISRPPAISRSPAISRIGAIACLVLCLTAISSVAQDAPVTGVRGVIAAVDTFAARMPREELYLHFDKPYYAAGDTIWFKAYLVDASRAASPLSSILYVELFNDSNIVIRRLALPVSLGLARGDIPLDEDGIPEGIYGIRAYTNWMRNFGESVFYYKYFPVGRLATNSVLVSLQQRITGDAGGQTARLSLHLTDVNHQPLRNRDLQVSVLEKKKVLYKERLTTSARGILQVDCELPGKDRARSMVISLEDQGGGSKKRTIIPVYFDNPENTDLQFLPESGPLVAGLPAHIAFKAVGEDGRGVAIKGFITDSHNKRLAAFTSLHKGMGAFDLAPATGETYTATVTLPGGIVKTYPLPVVLPSGTVIKVEDTPGSDSLRLSVYFSPDLVSLSHKYVLIGQSRGIVCYGANLVADKEMAIVKVPRRVFPTGIARFTLLDSRRQPLNERIIFIDQDDALRVHISADAGSYGPRDSIALHLTVTDAAGQPVAASFSLAVTDETQVKEDSLQRGNIITRLLLSSDLQGEVEDPAFYFQRRDSGTNTALDDLLLTQGWVGYDWKKIFGPQPAPAFLPETEFTVRGKATNLFNKPVKGTRVDLMASGGVQVAKDTITDDQGIFVFDKFPPFDTAAFFIQARNRRGKEFNIGVEVEETPPPALTVERPFPILPWYVNDQENFSDYLATNAAYRQEQDNILYPGKGKALPSFTVLGKKIVRDSKNLNGPGNADQTIMEDEVQKDGKINLLQLLEKEVTGFHEGMVRRSTQMTFMIREKRVRFIFDGVNLGYVMPGTDYFTLRSYLETYSAEDIKGVEVMFNPSHTSAYDFRYQSTRALTSNLASMNGIAWLEITTRSGHGPFQRRTPGTYLYRPQPFYIPRQFYRPRYTSGQAKGDFVDLRSTIHWSPDVITDTAGRATLSFFAADRPATYHIIAEGSDMNGSLGVGEERIMIKKP